jgi:hypothetical protein
MNDAKMKEVWEAFIVKTIKAELGTMFKNLQSIVAIGTILDYTGKRATVRVGGSVTGFIPYSKTIGNTQIGVGQMVITVSPDPNNLNNKVIVGTLSEV